MTDLTPTIAAKSDQLNADDLTASGPRTIRITRVTSGTTDQPIVISYEGDGGKPWKPCKSMRRVLVAMWGAQGSEYVGRSLTLFCDPSVKFGGIAVGGVRISHMSHIEADTVLMLTETRGKKAPYKLRKLTPRSVSTEKKTPTAEDLADALADMRTADSSESLNTAREHWRHYAWTAEQTERIKEAVTVRTAELTKDPQAETA